MKKRAVIFGVRGGIGSAVKTLFLDQGWQVIPINSAQINFCGDQYYDQISEILANSEADVIVNAAGTFVNGHDQTHHDTMNVNFGSNWAIIKYYKNFGNPKPVKIIMVGSSSYREGKMLYPLYSASKAALYNLWQSSRDMFADSNIVVDLINPVRTLTAMASKNKQIDPKLDYLSPEDVAQEIFQAATADTVSSCIDMNFKDSK
jgi:ribitol-5-phosphate 2-dehydrogenase (NADP+) / D-ribitol-5-phosphate cytidylyltransferase